MERSSSILICSKNSDLGLVCMSHKLEESQLQSCKSLYGLSILQRSVESESPTFVRQRVSKKNTDLHSFSLNPGECDQALRGEKSTTYHDQRGNEIINPLTPKISLVILLTVCHIIVIRLVWRIWCRNN